MSRKKRTKTDSSASTTSVVRDCGSQGIKSSTLVLRADGTYDQHVEFAGGEVLDEVGQHWPMTAGFTLATFE